MRAIGLRWLISGVARIFSPGCKADHCLVLEGPQGLFKSMSLQKLAIRPEWHTDRLSSIGSKDALMEIAGVLIIELAELDAIKRAASSTSKSFLTSTHDRFRPPWGTHTIRVPRQCIFAGSINPPAGGRYLKDRTGGRRFWPVACHGAIDVDGLTPVVDQLWAEAVHLYKAGHPWHLETPELEALATAEQTRRLIVDPWHPLIRRWVDPRPGDVAVDEVLTGVFDLTLEDQTFSDQTRVANILKDLGFYRVRTRSGDKRKNRYRRNP